MCSCDELVWVEVEEEDDLLVVPRLADGLDADTALGLRLRGSVPDNSAGREERFSEDDAEGERSAKLEASEKRRKSSEQRRRSGKLATGSFSLIEPRSKVEKAEVIPRARDWVTGKSCSDSELAVIELGERLVKAVKVISRLTESSS